MTPFGSKTVLGLDIGAASTKAVLLKQDKRGARLVAAETLNTREEGILTETELYNGVAGWLDNLGWNSHEITVGLPQYLATTQVSDFPAGVTDGLEEMVAYETQQLAGLSEESFIHDFHVMPPHGGRRNPVLIGICRESAIRERIAALEAAGIEVVDVAMLGLAAVNALLTLHPEVREGPDPQIVLDVGHENSTLIVLAAGQPLFVGSLLFGAERFTQAYARKRSLDEKDAERQKQTVDLTSESPSSPMTEAARNLESEIRNAIEHWEAQEQEQLQNADIGAIWICGGGARQPGLAQVIEDGLRCPAKIFGPPQSETNDPQPQFAGAYGLAMQGLENASATISLAPGDMRWKVARERRFGHLVAAAAVLTILLSGIVLKSYRTATMRGEQLSRTLEDLSTCEKLIPRLEGVMDALWYHESRVIPLVEKGNRGQRFITAFEDLAASCSPDDWFVYLADEAAYQRDKPKTGDQKDDAMPGLAAFPDPGGAAGRAPGVGDTVSTPEFQVRLRVQDLPHMQALIVAGYTPFVPTLPYEAVREIVRRLDASDTYKGVDLLPEPERIGREDIFEPWVRFFRAVPKGRYKAFTLVMPFAQLDVKTQQQKSESQ